MLATGEYSRGKNYDDRTNGGVGQLFGDIASRTSQTAGRALTFLIAEGVVILWAVTGPILQYSDTWQLVINTHGQTT